MAEPRLVAGNNRAALIGGGFIGPVHAEALRRIGIEVVGLLGSSADRARPVADRLRIKRVYADLDELLDDSAADVVHIASPNSFHFWQTCRVLEAGKHVVCEKPLATSSGDTSALVALAGFHPRQSAAVNYNVRYYPLCHEMRMRVARGDLGRILSVTGSYTQDWLLDPADYNWRVEGDGGSNLRAVADIGTHWMDLAQFVVGDSITDVLADLATFHGKRLRPAGAVATFVESNDLPGGSSSMVEVITEDYGAVLLRFGAKARGVFHVSQAHAGRKNRLLLEVAGTEGSMTWDSERPDHLWVGRRGIPSQLVLRDPSSMQPEAAAISRYPAGHCEGFPDTFKELFLAVYESLESGTSAAPSYPTFADGDREVRLCEAIARSATEGRWVRV